MPETYEVGLAEREILYRASELIAAGWCQGSFRMGHRYSLTGAILYGARQLRAEYKGSEYEAWRGTHFGAQRAKRRVRDAIQCRVGQAMPIERWQDKDNRTKVEVLGLLKDVLAEADAEYMEA